MSEILRRIQGILGRKQGQLRPEKERLQRLEAFNKSFERAGGRRRTFRNPDDSGPDPYKSASVHGLGR